MLNLMMMALVLQVPTNLDAALDKLASVSPGDGVAYAAARDKVLAFGKDAIPALAERGAPDRWTEAGWIRALAAESCRIRLAEPELAGAVDRPEGLDPATYRLFRKPGPMILPALTRRGADAVPLLIERWRWTFGALSFSEGAAGDRERETLRGAILALPGNVSDARARFFLADVLATAGLSDSWRGDAAVSLGIVGGVQALAKITACLDDGAQPAGTREACGRALGRIADPSALDAIRSRLPTEKDARVRRSYLTGLGILGSSWGWASRGKGVAAMADAVRAGCAEALVDAIRRHPEESETLGTALSLTAWPASLKSVESLASEGGASSEVRTAASAILPVLKRALSRRQ
jgi:hypothetical protein